MYQPLSTDLQKQQKYWEEFRVAKFLSGLKPDLDPIHSQILSGKDIPIVSETYARVRRAAISSSGVKDKRSALVGHYDTPQGERGDHSSRRCYLIFWCQSLVIGILSGPRVRLGSHRANPIHHLTSGSFTS